MRKVSLPRFNPLPLCPRSVMALAAGALFSVHAPAAHAGTIFVGVNGCTLVDAITAANRDAATGACPPGSGVDTIHLPAGSTQTLSKVNNRRQHDDDRLGIWGLTGLPVVTSVLAIEGHGSTIRRALGAPSFRILGVNPGGRLTLHETTITGGTTAVDGAVSFGRGLYGGGLMVAGGTAILKNSRIGENSGEGIFSSSGTLSLESSTVSKNSGSGILSEHGITTLIGIRSTDNRDCGVSVYREQLTIQDSTISGNAGCGVSLSDSVGDLKSTRIQDNGGPYGLGGIYQRYGDLKLMDCTVSGNSSVASGGGIFSDGKLDLISTRLIGNRSDSDGGGIALEGGGVSISNSTLAGNTAAGGGGGLWIVNASNPSRVVASTIADNSAVVGQGGGIFSAGGSGELALSNSTLSGNESGGPGGGLFFVGHSSLQIRNCTVTNNRATPGQGAGIGAVGAIDPYSGNQPIAPQVFASVIAGNVGTDVDLLGGSDIPFRSLGDNLIGDGNAVANFGAQGDRVRIKDAGLGPLADNGGQTLTHALVDGSPALDAVTGRCPPPVTDQRGVLRKQGSACDIGAFELEGGGSHGDTRPNRFSFRDRNDLAPGSLQTSNGVVVRGINAPAPIAVLGGDYSVNGSAYRSTSSFVQEGDRVVLRRLASAEAGATVSVRVSIGGLRDSWDLTTHQ